MLPLPKEFPLIDFDIEIANIFDLQPGEDLDAYGPFNISVAAAFDSGTNAHRVWHARDAIGQPTGTLDQALAIDMLTYLRDQQRAGKRLVAWNGLSFDLRWLGHAAGGPRIAAEIAQDLFDPMFHFFSLQGYPVSLQAVADGMGLKLTKLINGADAPKEWQSGNRQRVIDYVIEDCRITVRVAEAIESKRHIRWRTRKGTVSDVSLAKLPAVRDAMKLPEPDQSWMDKPMRRTRFYEWMRGM